MNIRRISTITTAGTALGMIAGAAFGVGGTQAASPCFDQGPNGPIVVDCPIGGAEFTPIGVPVPAALQQIIDRLVVMPDISSPSESGANEDGKCVLELNGGVATPVDCDVLAALTGPSIAGIGDIVFDPGIGGVTEVPVEDVPVDELPAVDEMGEIDAQVDEVAQPVGDEQTVTDESTVEQQPDNLTADEIVTEEDAPIAEETTIAGTEAPVEDSPETEAIVEVTPSEVAASATQPTGPLPRTGATTMGITLGIALMGLGGGAFAKLAATRRRS
jgi:hypothetical protein